MRENGAAVKWYRRRIHQKQREANALTIEVGLEAQDREDPGALSETIRCLETAIEILQRARTIGDTELDPEGAEQTQELMEDLGHSMAPLDLGREPFRRVPRAPYKNHEAALELLGAADPDDWRGGSLNEPIQLFE
jgi:hypothetical protein